LKKKKKKFLLMAKRQIKKVNFGGFEKKGEAGRDLEIILKTFC
jgi:hypothetical protein